MSKKATRRAARQAFPGGPPQVKRRDYVRGTKPQPTGKKGAAAGLRPPSLKRAVIQGAILAALYFILIRFIWRQEGSTVVTYVFFPAVAFVAYTVIAYFIDKYMYQRRLRRLKDQSK